MGISAHEGSIGILPIHGRDARATTVIKADSLARGIGILPMRRHGLEAHATRVAVNSMKRLFHKIYAGWYQIHRHRCL